MQTTQQLPQCSNCIDMERLVELLKVKRQMSPKHNNIQLLTLGPDSWSIGSCKIYCYTRKTDVHKSRRCTIYPMELHRSIRITRPLVIFCVMKMISSCKQSGVSSPPITARMLAMGSDEQ